MRYATVREWGGVLTPDEVSEKTGRLVKGIIQEKHPPLQDIDAVEPKNSTFDMYEDIPDAATLDISDDDVEAVS